MANLFLRRGPLSNLTSAPKIDGAISFTTDEPAIYLDVANEQGTVIRKRIGDLIQVDKIADLVYDPATMTGVHTDKLGMVGEWSDSALYYAIEENALLKCKITEGTNGNKQYTWTQVNATSDIEGDITILESRVNDIDSAIEDINASISDITEDKETGEKSLLNQTKEAAVAAAKTYTDTTVSTSINKFKTDVIDPLEDKVDSKVSTETYNANNQAIDLRFDGIDDELATLKNTTIPGITGDIEALELAIQTEKERAELAEGELNTAVEAINAQISSITTDNAQTGVKSLLNQTKDSAVATAKDYTDTTVSTSINTFKTDVFNPAISGLNDAVAKKVDSETYSAAIDGIDERITKLGTDTTEAIGKAKDEAISKIQPAINTHYTTVITPELNTKATKEELTVLENKVETKADAAQKLADAKAYTDQALAAADAMKFEGVVGGEGNLAALPTTGVKAGATYKVGAIGTYANNTLSYVGDLLIAKKDQAADETVYGGGWYHVSSGYEDDYSERLVSDDTTATVTLKNYVNQAQGSIQFQQDENSNVVISMESTYDEATRSNNSVVTVSMVWGTF